MVAGPGPGRLGDLSDRVAFGRREVLGDLAEGQRQDDAREDGPEQLEVVHVVLGDEERSHDGQQGRRPVATVDRGHGRPVSADGPHQIHADHGCDDAERRDDQGEDHGRRRVRVDGAEGRVAEDERRDDGDHVGLEEVGRHPRAVAHVVAHVVRDGGGVARIVLGDARLHLAHEVRSDVGGLGEDAAADPHEQREQRGPEGEAHQHGRGVVLEDEHDRGGAEQPQPDAEHPGDGSGAEGDSQGPRHRAVPGGSGGPHVAAHRQAHADETGQPRADRAGQEADDPVDPGLPEAEGENLVAVGDDREAERPGLDHLGGREEDQHREGYDDDDDDPELAPQERQGPLLDGTGDLAHRGCALVGRQDAAHEDQAHRDAHEPRDQREDEPYLVAAREVEGLVPAFRGELHHARCSLSPMSLRRCRRWRRRTRPPIGTVGGHGPGSSTKVPAPRVLPWILGSCEPARRDGPDRAWATIATG